LSRYFFHVCSSEKVDSEQRYSNAGFNLVVTPYPGCEFFQIFKEKHRCGRIILRFISFPKFLFTKKKKKKKKKNKKKKTN